MIRAGPRFAGKQERRREGDRKGRLAEATAWTRTARGRLGEPSLPVVT